MRRKLMVGLLVAVGTAGIGAATAEAKAQTTPDSCHTTGARPVLRQHQHNDAAAVRRAQCLLNLAAGKVGIGYTQPGDLYGPEIAQHVLDFQVKSGLTVRDGVVGPETWAALDRS